jgi:hypothetical protein
VCLKKFIKKPRSMTLMPCIGQLKKTVKKSTRLIAGTQMRAKQNTRRQAKQNEQQKKAFQQH